MTIILTFTTIPVVSFAKEKSTNSCIHSLCDKNLFKNTLVKKLNDHTTFIENGKSFKANLGGISIQASKSGKDGIKTLLEDGDKISMLLPKELSVGQGKLENGIITYNNSKNVKVHSQIAAEQVKNESFLFSRMMFQISDWE